MRRLDLLIAAVDQPGAAAVAGARVDLVELDHQRLDSAGDDQDQDDDDDRHRLEQHALAHPVLLLLAGDVLARAMAMTPRTST